MNKQEELRHKAKCADILQWWLSFTKRKFMGKQL